MEPTTTGLPALACISQVPSYEFCRPARVRSPGIPGFGFRWPSYFAVACPRQGATFGVEVVRPRFTRNPVPSAM